MRFSRAGDSIPEQAPCTEEEWLASPQRPLNWSPIRRWANVVILSLTNLIAGMTPAFEPALDEMMQDFHATDQSLKSLAVSVYVIAYCVGPLFIAPMSEVFGRIWILRTAYVIFVAMLLACSLSTTLSSFIAFRAIMGFAGIVFVVLGPAMVPDLIMPPQHGLALGLMTIGQTTGMTLGPFVGGFIVQKTTWRWILGSFTIAFGILAIIALGVLKETYLPILRNRQTFLMKPTGGRKKLSRLACIYQSPWARPLYLLFTSPILLLISLYSTVTVGYLLLVIATLGLVFQDQYNFSLQSGGLAYLGMTLGILVSQLSLGWISDTYTMKMERKRGSREPEDRLPFLIVGALLMPAGLLGYGWGLNTHWIVPVLGTLVLGIGIVLGWLPVTMYLVEVFEEHAASANGARTMVQSVSGALLPLAANPLYERLGYDWGNSLLAFIALVFVPFAVMLVVYGKQIRSCTLRASVLDSTGQQSLNSI